MWLGDKICMRKVLETFVIMVKAWYNIGIIVDVGGKKDEDGVT